MTVTEKINVASAPVAASTPAKASPKVASKPAAKVVAPAKKTPVAAQPVAKTAAKPVTKAATKPAVKTAPAKPAKVKKPKMIRDSFTFPKDEYVVLEALKLRAAKLGKPAKKTEVMRAGIKAIAALSDAAFLAALQAVPSLKTGRPANAKKPG